VDGAGRSAVVVGCGFGRDAEHLAGLGFRTVAFDISPTAVRAARERHPDPPVRHQTADLPDPPTDWRPGLDLVLESSRAAGARRLPDRRRRDHRAAVSCARAADGTVSVG
jgi:SAM-dependent methyltransferase